MKEKIQRSEDYWWNCYEAGLLGGIYPKTLVTTKVLPTSPLFLGRRVTLLEGRLPIASYESVRRNFTRSKEEVTGVLW